MATQKQLAALKKARAAKTKKTTKRKITKKAVKKATGKSSKSTKNEMQLDILTAIVKGDMPKARRILTKLQKS